jgi:hypothetical protein
MRQIYANTWQKTGQRNAFKSVRGSNHRVQATLGRLLRSRNAFSRFLASSKRQSCLDRANRPTGGFPHGGEGKPMMWRRAVFAESGQVLRSGVAFVLPQAVLRVDQVPLAHDPVPLDFCQNRGGRDGYGTRVAVNQRFLFDERVQPHRIEQQIIGSNFQESKGLRHCLPAGLIDIPRIDAARIDLRYAPGEGMFADAQRQYFTPLGKQSLGIIQADDAALGIQNHRGGHDRTE